MSDPFIIRDERPDDIEAVRQVVTDAFGQPDEAQLVDQLRGDGDAAILLVAERDGAIIGHVCFSKLDAPCKALALAPVSVAPAAQSQGVGSALICEGHRRAKAMGVEALLVLGEPAYYSRFGYDVEAARNFECPYSGPYLQALFFNEAAPRKGTLVYARAFSGEGL